MSYNYAERFEIQIEAKYKHGLTSADMATNNKYKFIDAQTIKIPTVAVSGYKDHKRDGSVNKGTITNEWTPYKLKHDRDISFYVDEMDVDETNQVLSAGNITATFMEDQAIPEADAYRYSKLYADAKEHGATVDTTPLTQSLEAFRIILRIRYRQLVTIGILQCPFVFCLFDSQNLKHFDRFHAVPSTVSIKVFVPIEKDIEKEQKNLSAPEY